MRLNIPVDHQLVTRFVELIKLHAQQQAYRIMLDDAARERWGDELADGSGYMDVDIGVIANKRVHVGVRYLFDPAETQSLFNAVSSLSLSADYISSQLLSCQIEANYNIGDSDDELWTEMSMMLGPLLTVKSMYLDFSAEQQDHPAATALALMCGGQ